MKGATTETAQELMTGIFKVIRAEHDILDEEDAERYDALREAHTAACGLRDLLRILTMRYFSDDDLGIGQ